MCFWVNLESHSSHANGFSPVWVLQIEHQTTSALNYFIHICIFSFTNLRLKTWQLSVKILHFLHSVLKLLDQPSLVSFIPAVHLKGRILGKSGSTVGALIGLRSCVCPLMQQQCCFWAKSLPTIRADMSQIVTFMYLRRNKDEMIK